MKVISMPICICGVRADEHIGKRCKSKKTKVKKIVERNRDGYLI